MAIDNPIRVECADLHRSGGITQIYLRNFVQGDEVTFDNNAGLHDITSMNDGASGTLTWQMFDAKAETANLSITSSKENGTTAFECTLTWYVPTMNSARFHEIQELLDECATALITDSNGVDYVVGMSEVFAVGGNNSGEIYRSQTPANLTSIEGGTGAAYQDENGVTLTLVAKQYELPRVYTGTITPNISAGTATTS